MKVLKKIKRINADVLIIGGGTAGSMAAIRTKELNPEAKVVVFDKSDIMYSGSIARGMDALNVTAVPGVGSAEEFLDTAHRRYDDIVDDPQCYAWVSKTWDLVGRLESWGMNFPKDDDGNYIVLNFQPKGKFCLAILEPDIKKNIAQRVYDCGAHVFNRTMAVRLIKKGERIVGAFGINIRNNECIMCSAKSVILTAGGTARFGQTTNGYPYGTFDFPGNTGEGYKMAYEAGAKMTGFEFTIVDYSVKDANAAGLHICLTRGAYVRDAFGNEIEGNNMSMSNLLRVHMSGRGPIRVKMQHLPDENVKAIENILFTTERPMQKRWFEGRGMDFRTHDVEQWPSEMFLCGGHGLTGILVNGNAETTVSGLFAAGDVANVNGFLPGALVMGLHAAESAYKYRQGLNNDDFINESNIDAFIEYIDRIKSLKGSVSIQEFEAKVRRTMTDYIAPPKNEFKLIRAIEEVKRLSRELYEEVGIREPGDVYKVLEVQSILTSGLLSATASLERRESRWGMFHFRSDYPEKNDADYKKHIILEKGKDEFDVTVSYKDVERMEV